MITHAAEVTVPGRTFLRAMGRADRAIGARNFTDLFNAIGEVCELFSPQECWNYFQAAGYAST
jgi:hypothetical protein